MWLVLALAFHVLSRLAYVVGVGVALTRQKRDRFFTRKRGIEPGFRRFRRLAGAVMTSDGVSFVLLCLASRSTLPSLLPGPVQLAAGVACIAIGIGVKRWAAVSLAPGGYYWRDVFEPEARMPAVPLGPYRWLRNPMYTVGYLHLYGCALVTGSLLGLAAAVFDQVAILVFHRLVEEPHVARLSHAGRERARVGQQRPA
jgi:protein-S-isoprenylcysteine O-methyltransferase Ste14